MNKIFTVTQPITKGDLVIMPGDELIYLEDSKLKFVAQVNPMKLKAESKSYCWMYNRKLIKIYPSEENLIVEK